MPSKQEIVNFIRVIPTLVKNLPYQKVVELCNYHFPLLPYSIVEFTNKPFFFGQREWSGSNVIYRGRKLINKNDKLYSNVADISYIQEKDIKSVKSFGRANKIEESMFYGSLNASTACIETVSKGEDFRDHGAAMLVLGTWKFESPLTLVEMPYSEKHWKLFYESFKITSEHLTEQHIKERNEHLRMQLKDDLAYDILTLFADAFAIFDVNNDSDYFLSNYFTDRILNKMSGFPQHNIDGIIYPSIPHSYQEKNIVLKPEVVRNKLRFIEAQHVWAVHFMATGGGAQFNPIQDKIYPDEFGNFKWRFRGA